MMNAEPFALYNRHLNKFRGPTLTFFWLLRESFFILPSGEPSSFATNSVDLTDDMTVVSSQFWFIKLALTSVCL